jgi:hypothetical protein
MWYNPRMASEKNPQHSDKAIKLLALVAASGMTVQEFKAVIERAAVEKRIKPRKPDQPKP